MMPFGLLLSAPSPHLFKKKGEKSSVYKGLRGIGEKKERKRIVAISHMF